MARQGMSASRPRGPSALKLVARAFPLWIGGALLVFGTVFGAVGVREALREHTYRDLGRAAEAQVVDKSIVRAERDGNGATRYVLSYRYATAEGEPRDGTADVSVEEWEQLEPGASLQIVYLPGEIDSSRVRGESNVALSIVFLSVGAVCALIGGAIAFVSGRSVAHLIRVLRTGTDTEGTVLRAGPTNVRINRVPQWQIHYRYRDRLGHVHDGASHVVSPREGSAWNEGDAGRVRFDPERPELSVWIGNG
jgi:hypothetical protein